MKIALVVPASTNSSPTSCSPARRTAWCATAWTAPDIDRLLGARRFRAAPAGPEAGPEREVRRRDLPGRSHPRLHQPLRPGVQRDRQGHRPGLHAHGRGGALRRHHHRKISSRPSSAPAPRPATRATTAPSAPSKWWICCAAYKTARFLLFSPRTRPRARPGLFCAGRRLFRRPENNEAPASRPALFASFRDETGAAQRPPIPAAAAFSPCRRPFPTLR